MRQRNRGRRCSNRPCPNMAQIKGRCRTCDRFARRSGKERPIDPEKLRELARLRREKQIEREIARAALGVYQARQECDNHQDRCSAPGTQSRYSENGRAIGEESPSPATRAAS